MSASRLPRLPLLTVESAPHRHIPRARSRAYKANLRFSGPFRLRIEQQPRPSSLPPTAAITRAQALMRFVRGAPTSQVPRIQQRVI
jgi:hypothetical protein